MSFDFLNQNNYSPQVNYKKVAEEFCKIYYTEMNKSGPSGVLYMFSPDVICLLGKDEHVGAYNTLIKISQMNVHRFGYGQIDGNSQALPNGSILITVTGKMNSISFARQEGKPINFTETFVLANTNSRYFVTNHILRTL